MGTQPSLSFFCPHSPSAENRHSESAGYGNPRAAYIHVPFCRHRCGYCDFTLVAGRDDLIDRYLTCLEREMTSSPSGKREPLDCGVSDVETTTKGLTPPAQEDRKLDTLFLGGGTPTHPPVEQLRRLFDVIHRHLSLAKDAEVSIEANPLDLTVEKIDLLAEFGVNRISLGVQSFDANSLNLLERDHRPEDIAEVMRRVRPRVENISLDLIFGVPGETLASWRNTLQQAIALEPTHISTYGLTWEQGTSFWTRQRRGELQAVDDGLERDQYALAMDELAAAGYEHYEISNFAQAGYRCRHNLVYWRGEEYLAFGPGAARYLGGVRETNVRSVLGWLERIEHGESPVAEAEQLEPVHRARELIYLGLRMIDGIDLAEFQDRTGLHLLVFAKAALDKTVSQGWIEVTTLHVRLTEEGRFVADRVIAEFL